INTVSVGIDARARSGAPRSDVLRAHVLVARAPRDAIWRGFVSAQPLINRSGLDRLCSGALKIRGGNRMRKALSFCAFVLAGSMLLTCTAAPSNAAVQRASGTTDTSASKIAKLAVATMSDLGAGWTQYRKAGGVGKFGKNDCAIKAGSP